MPQEPSPQVQALREQAEAAIARGDFRVAGALYNSALTLQPDDVASLLGKAGCQFWLDNPDGALATLDSALAASALEPRLWFAKGVLLCNLNRFQDGIDALTRFLEIAEPHDGNIAVAEEALQSFSAALGQGRAATLPPALVLPRQQPPAATPSVSPPAPAGERSASSLSPAVQTPEKTQPTETRAPRRISHKGFEDAPASGPRPAVTSPSGAYRAPVVASGAHPPLPGSGPRPAIPTPSGPHPILPGSGLRPATPTPSGPHPLLPGSGLRPAVRAGPAGTEAGATAPPSPPRARSPRTQMFPHLPPGVPAPAAGAAPFNEAEVLEKANALAQDGEFRLAVPLYDQLLTRAPQHADGWNNKGRCLEELGRVQEALNCYEMALRIDPHKENTLANKALLLANCGDPHEATKCAEQVLREYPQNLKAAVAKGLAQLRAGDAETAVRAFNAVLKIDPENFVALRQKGAALLRLDRSEEALLCLTKVTGIEPGDSASWIRRAFAEHALGRFEEARRSARTALDLRPSVDDATLQNLRKLAQ